MLKRLRSSDEEASGQAAKWPTTQTPSNIKEANAAPKKQSPGVC